MKRKLIAIVAAIALTIGHVHVALADATRYESVGEFAVDKATQLGTSIAMYQMGFHQARDIAQKPLHIAVFQGASLAAATYTVLESSWVSPKLARTARHYLRRR